MTNLARSGYVRSGAVARLMETTISSGEDRQQWLLARQGRVTATLAKELVRSGPGRRRALLEESFVPPVEITGNRYIDRGHEREPEIAAWVLARFGLEANGALLASRENDRHASTPDGVGETYFEEVDSAPRLTLVEIKTSKHDLDPTLPRGYFHSTGYLEQMQWQMHTTGATRTLFVWEQHDDDWTNGPTPLDLEPRFEWFERNDALIERMVAAADLFLAERDRMLAEQSAGLTGEAPVDEELIGLALAYLDGLAAEKVATARKQAPWVRMLALLAKRPEFSTKTGLAQVTWTNRVDVSVVPDEDAARAAHPEGLPEDVTGADLELAVLHAREALERSPLAIAVAEAEATWREHLALHTKRTERSVQKLTVTAPKPPKGDAR